MVINLAEYKLKNKTFLLSVKLSISKFVKAINEHEPDTFYEAFQKEDSLEFVHVMKFPNKEAEKNHAEADYTQEFVKTLYPLCEKEPVFTSLSEIN